MMWQYAIWTLSFKSLFFLNGLFAILRELVPIFCKRQQNKKQTKADILDWVFKDRMSLFERHCLLLMVFHVMYYGQLV